MKLKVLMIMLVVAVLSLFAGVLYAANGDLIVDGNLGVGTDTPQNRADINGNMRVSGNLVTTGSTTLGGNTAVNGTLTVSGQVSAPGLLSKFYESSEQTVAQTITVAHGLGSKPKIARVVARCKTAEQGYAVGDEIDVTYGGYASFMGYFTL